MKTIHVVILSSDRQFVRNVEIHFAAKQDLRVIGTANNGKDGLRLIRRERPDVVLLDLVLPGMNGDSVLLALRRLTRPPVSIVCTEMYTESTVRIARKYGASSFLCRPVDLDCLSRAVVDCFQFSATETMPPPRDMIPRASLSPAAVRRSLADCGLSPTLSGCHYLAEAIVLVDGMPSKIANLTHNVYAEIGARNHVSVSSVERCIRSAIFSAFSRHGALFPLPQCPTNREFIQYMCERVRLCSSGETPAE